MRIAQNDPRLAHAVVRTAARQQVEALSRFRISICNVRTAADYVARVAGHFRWRLLCLKLSGKQTSRSRGRVEAIVADPDHEGNYQLFAIGFDAGLPRGRTWVRGIKVELTGHCIARIIQRSTGEADVGWALQHIRDHLLTGIHGNFDNPVGTVIKATDPTGQLILVVDEEGWLIAKTWIDDRTAPAMTVSITQGEVA